MRRLWSDIAHERETQALAERLELRLHAIALVITAIVLAMRLVAGTRDLSDEVSSATGESAHDDGASAHVIGI